MSHIHSGSGNGLRMERITKDVLDSLFASAIHEKWWKRFKIAMKLLVGWR